MTNGSEVRWVSDYWGIVEFLFPEPPWFDAMSINFDDDQEGEGVTDESIR